MPPSTFQGVQLLERLPRYATLRDYLLLDHPAAARLRQIVDAWGRADPPAVRAKTRTDLLGETSCEGTFSELVLRQVLKRKFSAVVHEPRDLPVGNKTPDFAVRIGPAGRRVVFDSTTILEKVEPLIHRRRDIMRRLDRIPGPWHLIPHWVPSTGMESVPPSVIQAKVRAAIAGLPAAEHCLRIPIGEAVFRADLIPTSQSLPSIVSIDASAPVVFSPGVESVKNDIETKTRRYHGLKSAGIPFILAVGSGVQGVNFETLWTAMYGNERVTIKLDSQGRASGAEPAGLDLSGAVTPNRDGLPRYSTLSAAWLVRWIFDTKEMSADVVHFPNPWAENPIRIPGRDIARVRFSWINEHQVRLMAPRHRRLLKVS
jgi:hypothetical protein